MEVKIQKLSEDAILPKRGTVDSAGYDLYSTTSLTMMPWTRKLIPLDLIINVPKEHYGRIAPRSGLALKGIDVAAGVIDSDYLGNVGVILVNNSDVEYNVSKGDRIAQLIFEKISTPLIVESKIFIDTERGQGGFGSTGK